MSLVTPRAPGVSAIDRLLGIDIGGTKLALAVGDGSGAVLAARRRPTAADPDPRRAVAGLVEEGRALLARAGAPPGRLRAVGVACPGPLDAERGLVLDPPNLPGWTRVPLVAWLAEAFGAPVFLENDANAAALAEWRFGAGRGARDLVYLTMSTGVGAGLVLDGRLYRGRSRAGEIGHAPVEWDGTPCVCGLRGCLEAYVGGAAWARRLRREAPPDGAVARAAGGVERVTPEHVVAAARAGDAFALAELDGYNEHLARALVQLVCLLAPERIVLGTIPTAAGEALCLGPVRRRVEARVWPVLARGLQILPSALGDALPERAGLGVALEGLGGAG